MEYNTQRSPLKIGEYGRSIQKMLDYAMTIEDRAKRNTMARMIVSAMAQICPQSKDLADHKHKLWDHLFIMSDYKLDVDSPYPIPIPQEQTNKPRALSYPDGKIEYPHYGKYIQKMITKISEMDEGKEKEILINRTAHYLKKSYLTWNRDSVDDKLIHENFSDMSDGRLKLTESFQLKQTKDLLNIMNNHKSKNNRGKNHKNVRKKPMNTHTKKK